MSKTKRWEGKNGSGIEQKKFRNGFHLLRRNKANLSLQKEEL
jgi:hypothetical protein